MVSRLRFIESLASSAAALHGSAARASRSLSNSLRALAAAKSRIVALDVLHLGNDVSTQVLIPPGGLEGFGGLRRHHLTDRAAIGRLIRTIAALEPEPDTARLEYRWELRFRDAGRRVVATVFQSSGGGYAMIDGVACRCRTDALLRELERLFERVDS